MSYSVKKDIFIKILNKTGFPRKSIFLAIFDAFGLMHECVCGGRRGVDIGAGAGERAGLCSLAYYIVAYEETK